MSAMKSLKWTGKTAKWIGGLCAPVIVSALLQWHSLAGLGKLRAVTIVIIKGQVPAWAFIGVSIVAVVGLLFFAEYRPRRFKLHFVPSPDGCNWGHSVGDKDVMFLCIRGTFTNEGEDVQLLSFYPKGTRQVKKLRVFQYDYSDTPVESSSLNLPSHEPREVVIYTWVTPVRGKEQQQYGTRIICRTQRNEHRSIGSVTFEPKFPENVPC
jgi:hypothetical protein